MTLLEDKRFIREGRSIREWILNLASEQKDVRDKASDVLYEMELGIESNGDNSDNCEIGSEIDSLFPKAVEEVFNHLSSAEIQKMLKVIERNGKQLLSYNDKVRKVCESDNNEYQMPEEEAKEGHHGMINLDILKYAGTKMRDAIDIWIEFIVQDAADSGISQTAAEALGNIGTRAKSAFPVLFKKMCASNNPHHYAYPIAQIIKDDEELQKQIVLFLNDSDFEKISACLLILRHLDTVIDIMRPLKSLSGHQEEKVRGLVARVYGKIGNNNNEIRDILLNMIKTEKEHNRSVAIESLAKTCSNSDIVVPILINALSDPDYSFCQYEGCVESASVYLFNYANKAQSMKPYEEIFPVLQKHVKEMDGISNEGDDLGKIQLLSRFGPKAKKALPKLKRYLKSFLEDDPKAKEKTTRILKQAVEAIEKDNRKQ
jgi:hypothetical protein